MRSDATSALYRYPVAGFSVPFTIDLSSLLSKSMMEETGLVFKIGTMHSLATASALPMPPSSSDVVPWALNVLPISFGTHSSCPSLPSGVMERLIAIVRQLSDVSSYRATVETPNIYFGPPNVEIMVGGFFVLGNQDMDITSKRLLPSGLPELLFKTIYGDEATSVKLADMPQRFNTLLAKFNVPIAVVRTGMPSLEWEHVTIGLFPVIYISKGAGAGEALKSIRSVSVDFMLVNLTPVPTVQTTDLFGVLPIDFICTNHNELKLTQQGVDENGVPVYACPDPAKLLALKDILSSHLISTEKNPTLPLQVPNVIMPYDPKIIGRVLMTIRAAKTLAEELPVQRRLHRKLNAKLRALRVRASHTPTVELEQDLVVVQEAITKLNDTLAFTTQKIPSLLDKACSIALATIPTETLTPIELPDSLESYLKANKMKILKLTTQPLSGLTDPIIELDQITAALESVHRGKISKTIRQSLEALSTCSILQNSSSVLAEVVLAFERAEPLSIYRIGEAHAKLYPEHSVSSCLMYMKFGDRLGVKPVIKILPTSSDCKTIPRLMSYGDSLDGIPLPIARGGIKHWPLAFHIHPHSAPFVRTRQDLTGPVDLKSITIPAGCLGEAQAPMITAALNNDLWTLVTTAHSWYKSANEEDFWGKSWPLFKHNSL